MSAPPLAACRLADAALLGLAVNVVTLLAMPLARPDLDLFRYALSYYVTGPWGAVQSAGFVAMGLSSLALAWVVSRVQMASPWREMIALLLAVAGAAALGLVVYPMGQPSPMTFLGDAHQTAGTIGGVAQLAAALAFTLAARVDPRWRRMYLPAVVAFTVALLGAVLTQLAIWRPDLGIPMGAVMRLVVVPLVLLWGLVAWRLRQRCGAGTTRSAAAR